jgi:uncharacterized protein YoxC
MIFIIAVAGFAVAVAGATLVVALLPAVAEIQRTVRQGHESVRRVAPQIELLREEAVRIRTDVETLTEAVTGWQKLTLLPAEITHLSHSIRILMKTSAFIAVLRQSPWRQAVGFQVRNLLQNIIQGG